MSFTGAHAGGAMANTLANNLVTTNLVASYRADLGITESGTVSQWNDQSGSGWNLTESTYKPTYNASGGPNGQPYVSFDTRTDVLTNTSVSVAQPVHIYIVLRQVTWVLNRYILVDNLSHPYVIQGPSTPQLAHSGGGTQGNEISPTIGTWFLVETAFDNANAFQRLNNGTKSEATTSGTQTLTGLLLCGEGTNLGAIYDVAEIAIYGTAFVSGSAHTQNVTHFNDRYSLGI